MKSHNIIFKNGLTPNLIGLTSKEVIEFKTNNFDLFGTFDVNVIEDKQPIPKSEKKALREDFENTMSDHQREGLKIGSLKMKYSESGNFWYLQVISGDDKEFYSSYQLEHIKKDRYKKFIKNAILNNREAIMKDVAVYCSANDMDLIEDLDFNKLIHHICFIVK